MNQSMEECEQLNMLGPSNRRLVIFPGMIELKHYPLRRDSVSLLRLWVMS